MTATDVLRRLLDEHDEYYKTSGNKTWWGRPIDRQTGKPINVFHYQAQPMGEDRLLIELQLATPEQAIAATLGRRMLTADDVRDLIERHSDASGGNGRDFHNGAYAAIADELNATLGSRNCSNNCTNSERTETCHMVLREDIRGHAYQDTYECSECGEYVVRETCMGESEPPNFCPNCGRRVVQ